MDKKRVLVVDDEVDIVETIKFTLELEGIEVLVAYDGEDALIKAKQENPDLIILDVMMPKINGYNIARLLKLDDTYMHIPIIMLTARSKKTDIHLGEEIVAEEFVVKPFEIKLLVDLVHKYLHV